MASTGGNLVRHRHELYDTEPAVFTTGLFAEAAKLRGRGSKVGPVDNTIYGGGSSIQRRTAIRQPAPTSNWFRQEGVREPAGNRIIELRKRSWQPLLAIQTINLAGRRKSGLPELRRAAGKPISRSACR